MRQLILEETAKPLKGRALTLKVCERPTNFGWGQKTRTSFKRRNRCSRWISVNSSGGSVDASSRDGFSLNLPFVVF